MTRVKRGTIAHKRRKKVLRYAKGFKWTRKTKYRQAKEALLHAWTHSFSDRRKKKRVNRRLWQIKISAAAKENALSYSKLIHLLKKQNIDLDRKILSQIADQEPEVFKKIINSL